MNIPNAPMSFMAACRDFFGMKPNQRPLEFGAEIKALNEAERAYFRVELEKLGYTIQASVA
jgi:hypothetical protein